MPAIRNDRKTSRMYQDKLVQFTNSIKSRIYHTKVVVPLYKMSNCVVRLVDLCTIERFWRNRIQLHTPERIFRLPMRIKKYKGICIRKHKIHVFHSDIHRSMEIAEWLLDFSLGTDVINIIINYQMDDIRFTMCDTASSSGTRGNYHSDA